MAFGREVADAYISVHGDTGPFRRDLTRAGAAMRKMNKDNEKDSEKSWGRVGKSSEKAIERMRGSWRRMDGTVKLVIGLIASAGDQMATLGSGLAGAGTALASTLGIALANAIPLAATMPGLAYGIGLAVASIKQIMDAGGPTADALKGIGKAFQEVAVPAFTKQWEGSLRGFAQTMRDVLLDPTIPTALGKNFSRITDAFTAVLKSPPFKAFQKEMGTTLATSIGNLGVTVANLTKGLLSMFAAAGPAAQRMTASFQKASASWAASMETMRKNGTLQRVFDTAYTSGAALMGLSGALGRAIGGIFMIGAKYGDKMANDLAALTNNFTAWMNTAKGQAAINKWFADGLRIMYAMKPLIVGLAQAMSILVTERAIQQWTGLNAALGHALPQLAQLLNVVGGLDLLGNLARLIDGVTSAFAKMAGPLDQIAVVLGDTLGALVFGISKALSGVATALVGPLQAAVPGVQAIGSILSTIFLRVGDAIAQIAAIIGPTLVPVIQAISSAFVSLQAPMGQIAALITTGLVSAFQALQPAFSSVGNILAAFATAIGALAVALQPTIALLGTMFSGALSNLAPVINNLFQQVGTFLIPIFYDLARSFQVLGPRFAELAGIVVQFVSQGLAQLGPALAGIGPMFGQLSPLVGAIGQAFLAVLPSLQLMGHAFLGMLPSIVQIGQSLLAALMPALASLIPAFMSLAPLVADLVMQFVMFASGALPVVAQLFSQLMTVITPLIPMVVQFVTMVAQLALTFLSQLLPALLPIIQTLGTGLMSILQVLAPIFFQIISAVGQLAIYFLQQLLPAILPLLPIINQLIQVLVAALVPAFQLIGTIITAVMPIVMAIVKSVIDNVVGLVQGLVTVIQGVTNVIQGIFTGDWNRIWTGLGQIVSGAVQAIWNFIQLWIVGRVVQGIRAALTIAKGLFTSIWNGISSFVSGALGRIVGFVSSGMSRVSGFVSSVMSSVRGFFSGGWNAAVGFVSGAWSRITGAVSSGVGTVMSWVGALPGRIMGALSGLAGQLYSAGTSMMQGMVNGISNMAGNLVQAGLNAVGNAINAVKNFLGIRSPSRLMFALAQMTWQGFISGGDRMSNTLANAGAKMAATAVGAFDRSKMFIQGRDAAAGLASGLASNTRLINGAISKLPSIGGAGGKIGPVAVHQVGAAGQPAAAGGQTIFAEGAIQFQTQVQDPKTAAKQLMDVLARGSKAG